MLSKFLVSSAFPAFLFYLTHFCWNSQALPLSAVICLSFGRPHLSECKVISKRKTAVREEGTDLTTVAQTAISLCLESAPLFFFFFFNIYLFGKQQGFVVCKLSSETDKWEGCILWLGSSCQQDLWKRVIWGFLSIMCCSGLRQDSCIVLDSLWMWDC